LKDYYALLGLPREASKREIKRAYKKLIRKWHPDLHPDDPASSTKVQELNEAYGVLSAPEKRQAYDRQTAEGGMAEDRDDGLYSAHHEHPFFSYFRRANDALRRKTGKE